MIDTSYQMKKVIVRDCERYDADRIREIANEALDAFNVRIEGKKVLLKPNMLGPFKPEQGVTTHPAFITALLEAVRHRGAARVIVGDNPAMVGYGKTMKVARVTGILEASGDAFAVISAAAMPAKVCGMTMLISREVMEADVVINLPRFKSHLLTLFTGAIKNMFGIVVGTDKVNTHREFANPDRLSAAMADVCALRPPDLSILDAIRVMEGNGPSAGSLRSVGKIIASSDPVAVDRVALGMMGVPIEKVPMIGRAVEIGLGSADGFEVEGEATPIPKFKLPVTVKLPSGFIEYLVNRIGCFFVSRRIPKLIKKRCDGCQDCVRGCPTGALAMKDGRPTLNKAACVSCFCCTELCPQGAWKIRPKIL